MKYLDIVKIKTGQLAVVSRVSHCLHTDGKNRSSCILTPLDKNNWSGKEAWFYDEEIEVVANVIDLMAKLNLTDTARTCVGTCGGKARDGSNYCQSCMDKRILDTVGERLTGTKPMCTCVYPDPPKPDCPVHGLPRVTPDLKSSEEWARIYKNKFKVLDPDGWDRSNFTKSWAELITEEEFNLRVAMSTCEWFLPTTPDLSLHVRVAKALGKKVSYCRPTNPKYNYWGIIHDKGMPTMIPDYPNDLVAATEAFDLYFELRCRKIDDHFDYWIERIYRDGWKWRVRLGFADKSVIADSQAEGLCLAIVADAESR